MHRPAATSPPAPQTFSQNDAPGTPVDVTLLGVRVTAYAVINIAEHSRREAAGLGAVINPALLDHLLDLPVDIPVNDPVMWTEMADQPSGILERGRDGTRITRRLESPLTIPGVVVKATPGTELRSVQDASLFAGFTRRWVEIARGGVPDAALLEAKLCGVGIFAPGPRVLLPAEKPVALTIDGWSWLLEEKAYRSWLTHALVMMRRRAQLQPLTEPARRGKADAAFG
jgi:hypothetical protein